jgi:hypothetical protein
MEIYNSQTGERESDPEKGSICVGIDAVQTESLEHTTSTQPINGLSQHMAVQLTPEEKKAERAYLRKIDATILIMLALMFFLASLVSLVP